MNNFFRTFTLCSLTSLAPLIDAYASAETSSTLPVKWQANFEIASEQAKQKSKPMLLLFTGPDWCQWTGQLQAEVFAQEQIQQQLQARFVLLECPFSSSLNRQIAAQNKQLRRKFDVRNFPSVILLDPHGQKMGMLIFRPGTGKEFVNHIFQIIDDFNLYTSQFQQLGLHCLEALELLSLYEKAKGYGREQDQLAILKEGVRLGEDLFFLKEYYRYLARRGKIQDSEAIAIKERLLQLDPNNEHQSQYHLALVQFECNCEAMEREKFSPEWAAAPLVDYIDQFGQEDQANTWRLEMALSQLYLDNNKPAKALLHAKHSLKLAPEGVQKELQEVIRNLQQSTVKGSAPRP